MIARCFVDTNILIYAGSAAVEDAMKRSIAAEILRLPSIGFSSQVLQEYYEVAYRKKRLGISHAEAIHALRQMSKRPVVCMTPSLIITAAEISDRFGITYWDAAIIAAAHELQCETLYSEDLNHGQRYDGLQVVNPFL
ncbi:MAG TPA: PIN domain-containing protein [Kiritimatiellia bacterium]|nr:PIN domain-containing protein [Kiritimatiellia bacterium]